MAPQVEDPPCHLLRMPYEILKAVLAELNQQDQLSISKTCVTLWELAYPLAYNRITIEIGPTKNDAAWSHLASGVGIRYVRHLQILSDYEESTKPKGNENLVTGTLVAALPRNQLSSFSLSIPSSSARSLSIQNVVILLETQRHLQSLDLPAIHGAVHYFMQNFLHAGVKFGKLRHLTLTISSSALFFDRLRDITSRSTNLEGIHLRFPYLSNKDDQPFLNALQGLQSITPRVFPFATKVTLHGYRFDNHLAIVETFSFPCLRALAVVDCYDVYIFFLLLKSTMFPRLAALVVRGNEYIGNPHLSRFIQDLGPLRELIVNGKGTWFDDGQIFTHHTQSLEILSLHQRISDASEMCALGLDSLSPLFEAMTSLRHLGIYVGNVWLEYPRKDRAELDDEFRNHLDIMTCYDSIRTLDLQCSAYNIQLPSFTDGDPARLRYGADIEDRIGREVLKQLSRTARSESLRYLSVAYKRRLYTEDPHSPCHNVLPANEKRIFSLQPKPVLRPAAEVKEEIMVQYAGEGYYFLEEYVDGMMTASRSVVVV